MSFDRATTREPSSPSALLSSPLWSPRGGGGGGGKKKRFQLLWQLAGSWRLPPPSATSAAVNGLSSGRITNNNRDPAEWLSALTAAAMKTLQRCSFVTPGVGGTLREELMWKNIKKQYGASFSQMRENTRMRLQSGGEQNQVTNQTLEI